MQFPSYGKAMGKRRLRGCQLLAKQNPDTVVVDHEDDDSYLFKFKEVTVIYAPSSNSCFEYIVDGKNVASLKDEKQQEILDREVKSMVRKAAEQAVKNFAKKVVTDKKTDEQTKIAHIVAEFGGYVGYEDLQ